MEVAAPTPVQLAMVVQEVVQLQEVVVAQAVLAVQVVQAGIVTVKLDHHLQVAALPAGQGLVVSQVETTAALVVEVHSVEQKVVLAWINFGRALVLVALAVEVAATLVEVEVVVLVAAANQVQAVEVAAATLTG